VIRRIANISLYLTILFFILPRYSQEFRATAAGHVLDTSGKAIPNASVEVVNLANNENHVATTDNSGSYTVPLLQPGDYRLTIRPRDSSSTCAPE
jgi:hypothetical protein